MSPDYVQWTTLAATPCQAWSQRTNTRSLENEEVLDDDTMDVDKGTYEYLVILVTKEENGKTLATIAQISHH